MLVLRSKAEDERRESGGRIDSRISGAAPATVSGEPLVQNGHWATGKAGRAAKTREPGDLPARSPNRWTRGPYGAVFRSGDGNAGAKAVRAKSPTTFRM